jgi:hypothetical protein
MIKMRGFINGPARNLSINFEMKNDREEASI